MHSILTIEDLTDDDVGFILRRAAELSEMRPVPLATAPRVLGLVFFSASLRTRTGFAAAAARRGWQVVPVDSPRQSPTAMAESWHDTLRTVAGYADAIVARPGVPLGPDDRAIAAPCPLINGGDAGPKAQHPTQALIDVFAMERLFGSIAHMSLAIVGDPRMRAVRSLLSLLSRRPPAKLAIVADPSHLEGVEMPAPLVSVTRYCGWDGITDSDVVYVAGIPHGALVPERRNALLATSARLAALSPNCILLSPMPIIDEMDAVVKSAPSNRMYVQSDLGLWVRMAILDFVGGGDRAETGTRPAV